MNISHLQYGHIPFLISPPLAFLFAKLQPSVSPLAWPRGLSSGSSLHLQIPAGLSQCHSGPCHQPSTTTSYLCSNTGVSVRPVLTTLFNMATPPRSLFPFPGT